MIADLGIGRRATERCRAVAVVDQAQPSRQRGGVDRQAVAIDIGGADVIGVDGIFGRRRDRCAVDARHFILITDADNEGLVAGQAAGVGGAHDDFVGRLRLEVEHPVGEDQLIGTCPTDTEHRRIGAADNAVGGAVASVLIGGSETAHRVAATGIRVLGHRAVTQGNSARRLVDIGHGHRDGLGIQSAVAVVHLDSDFIDVVSVEVGRILVIWRVDKRQYAAGAVDGEFIRIGAGRVDAAGEGIQFNISGGDGGDGGGVFVHIDAGRSAAAVGGDDRGCIGIQQAKIGALGVAIAVAGPDDHRLIVAPGHAGIGLTAKSGGIDLHLGAERTAAAVELAGVDTIATAVLIVALPGDDDIAGVVHGDSGYVLCISRGGIDLDFTTLGSAAGIVVLGINAITAAVLQVAGPGDGEAAVSGHGDLGAALVIGGGGIDEELTPLGGAGGIETLAVDTVTAAILVQALPDHHEIAGIVSRHGADPLFTGGGGVDLYLVAEGVAGCVELAGIDAIATAVLAVAGPGDNVIPRSVCRHGGLPLIAGGGLIDLEFAALGYPGSIK